MKHPEDGKFVAVQGNQRVSSNLHETQAGAQAEADKAKQARPVQEGQASQPEPKVVQNLLG